MTGFDPTPEQANAVDVFASGVSMALDALAGTGKTATLELLAEHATGRRGAYMAFNTSIVKEAALRFPAHVECRTVHSFAYRAVGNRYARRLRGGRMRGDELARRLGVDPYIVSYGSQRKVLQPSFLAGHAMKAVLRFCQSADPEPARHHVAYIDGIDAPAQDGARTWDNNDRIRDALLPTVRKAWADLADPDGQLPFRHDAYVKVFALGDPQIGVDFLLLDEAQDLSRIMLQIAQAQRDCQLVLVGDANQSIYSWRGSIDAMSIADVAARATLTCSFRFGPPIADVANWLLDRLPTGLRVTGSDRIDSRVGPVDDPRAVLTRTNAGGLEVVFDEQRRGRRPCLLGGGEDVASFARAARDLMERGHTGHPELACFDSWNDVRAYTEHDPQGDELALMVRLVDDYGTGTILSALERMPGEDGADVVVSTAHKAKGRQWRSVRVHSDFKAPEAGPAGHEEYRLLYVSATRAQEALDVSGCPAFAELVGPRKAVGGVGS